MIDSWPLLGITCAGAILWALHLVEKNKKGLYTLLYHRLHPDDVTQSGSEALFSVSEKRFMEQIDGLIATGYHFIDPNEAIAMLEGDIPLRDKTVLLAFDDGCESIVTMAEPILSARNIKAMVFVTTDPNAFVFHLPSNPQARCSEEQLKQLSQKGWGLGVHSATHLPPGVLKPDELSADFTESTEWLSKVLDTEVMDYAVPGNFQSPVLTRTAKQRGIRRVWSATPGVITSTSNPDSLPRLGVEGTMTGKQLINSLQPWGRLWRRGLSWTKRMPVRLIGPAKWIPIRRWLFHALSPFSLSHRFWAILFLGITLLLAFIGISMIDD